MSRTVSDPDFFFLPSSKTRIRLLQRNGEHAKKRARVPLILPKYGRMTSDTFFFDSPCASHEIFSYHR